MHPNTDGPTLHNVTPSQAWEWMFSHFGFQFDAQISDVLHEAHALPRR
ncbi:hypothetical protein [Mycetohabitans sp. B3]|nr:hypothetical protein [Mycetohabitans sp. B3]MCF2134353.1 hypothetical protein [Mycetohabitans sp. B3]